MKINALSVANHFVELAQKDGIPLRPLGLIKRVYIAHGFSLALTDRSLLDERFDRVEAWKYGPVIPSVYHSFKKYGGDPIKERTTILDWSNPDDVKEKVPTLEVEEDDDEKEKREKAQARAIVESIWRRYLKYTDGQLVDLTHKDGSPWDMFYIAGENNPIPDTYTRLYYKEVFEKMKRSQEEVD